jgi:hypothetical protein
VPPGLSENRASWLIPRDRSTSRSGPAIRKGRARNCTATSCTSARPDSEPARSAPLLRCGPGPTAVSPAAGPEVAVKETQGHFEQIALFGAPDVERLGKLPIEMDTVPAFDDDRGRRKNRAPTPGCIGEVQTVEVCPDDAAKGDGVFCSRVRGAREIFAPAAFRSERRPKRSKSRGGFDQKRSTTRCGCDPVECSIAGISTRSEGSNSVSRNARNSTLGASRTPGIVANRLWNMFDRSTCCRAGSVGEAMRVRGNCQYAIRKVTKRPILPDLRPPT